MMTTYLNIVIGMLRKLEEEKHLQLRHPDSMVLVILLVATTHLLNPFQIHKPDPLLLRKPRHAFFICGKTDSASKMALSVDSMMLRMHKISP